METTLKTLGFTESHGFFDYLPSRFPDLSTDEKKRLNVYTLMRWGNMGLVEVLTADNIGDVIGGIEMLRAKRWDWLDTLVWDNKGSDTVETVSSNSTDDVTEENLKNGFESSPGAPKLDTKRVSTRGTNGGTTRTASGYSGNKAEVFKFNNRFTKTNLYETVLEDIMEILVSGTQIPNYTREV